MHCIERDQLRVGVRQTDVRQTESGRRQTERETDTERDEDKQSERQTARETD